MNARSRKKRLYWHDSHAVRGNCPRADRTVTANSRAWRLIEAVALRVFGNNYIFAWDWFTAPALAFNGMRPADLMLAGDVQAVKKHLIRMEYCVYM